MHDPFKIFRILIKFMDSKYVEPFVNEGLMFMNNIEFFRKFENKIEKVRGDVFEGLTASYLAENLEIKIGDHLIRDAVGKVDVRYNHEDETNIYSMTKISDGNVLDAGEEGLVLSDKFLKFGDKALFIGGSDIPIFESRLKSAIEKTKDTYTLKKDNIFAKQVDYLNRDIFHGEMDIFNKFREYSWQYEWRISIKQTNRKGPYCLKIGNLSDIVKIYNTKDLIKMPIKLAPKNL